MKIISVPFVSVGLLLALTSQPIFGQESDPIPLESTSARQMTRAALRFLETLSEPQREGIVYPFAGEHRTNWSNVPPFVHDRPGLRLGDLTYAQRQGVHDLLRASTSSQGYQKITGVIRLDGLHRERELEALATEGPAEGERPYFREEAESFGTGSYAIALFGDPRIDGDWGWLIQGHHLGASFTVADGRAGFTPLFLGAIPLVLERGLEAGWSALSHEGTRAFELMATLSPEQRARAIEPEDAPNDVLAGVGRNTRFPEESGLPASEMREGQQRLLRVLVEEYVRNSDFDAAEAQLEAIGAAGWDRVRFSWRGETDNLSGQFYYRVQGPRILIESAQRPNHVHTIMRDPLNDYGANWLDEVITELYSAADRFDAAVTRYETGGGGQ